MKLLTMARSAQGDRTTPLLSSTRVLHINLGRLSRQNKARMAYRKVGLSRALGLV